MLPTVRLLASPFFAIALLMLSSGLFTTFLSLYMEKNGFSFTEIGILHSVYYLGWLYGSYLVEKRIYFVGLIRAFAGFCAITSAAILIQTLSMNYALWLGMRFISGLAFAALYVVIETWILLATPVKIRGQIIGVYIMIEYTFQALGNGLLGYIALESEFNFIIASLFTILAIIPVSMIQIQVPETENTIPIRVSKLIKLAPFGVFSCFVSGLLLSALYSFLPIIALQDKILNPSTTMIGLILGGSFLQIPLGHLSDLFNRRMVLLLLSLSLVFYPLLSLTPLINIEIYNFLYYFFLGGLIFTLYPMGINHLCDSLFHKDVPRATMVIMAVYGLGCVFGPLLASYLAQNSLGGHGLTMLISGSCVLLSLLGTVRTVAKQGEEEEQSDFIAVPQTSLATLDAEPELLGHEDEEEADCNRKNDLMDDSIDK
jgi:MFS family permease